jgi:hypothetical protein
MSENSDSPVLRVLNVLLDSMFCESCLSQTTGLGVGDVGAALYRLTSLVMVTETHGTCEMCRRSSVVYELGERLRGRRGP